MLWRLSSFLVMCRCTLFECLWIFVRYVVLWQIRDKWCNNWLSNLQSHIYLTYYLTPMSPSHKKIFFLLEWKAGTPLNCLIYFLHIRNSWKEDSSFKSLSSCLWKQHRKNRNCYCITTLCYKTIYFPTVELYTLNSQVLNISYPAYLVYM